MLVVCATADGEHAWPWQWRAHPRWQDLQPWEGRMQCPRQAAGRAACTNPSLMLMLVLHSLSVVLANCVLSPGGLSHAPPGSVCSSPCLDDMSVRGGKLSRGPRAPAQAGPTRHFWDVWRLYGIDLRHWSFQGVYFRAIPAQTPKLLALFFTVAFGSSMDVVHPPSLPAPSFLPASPQPGPCWWTWSLDQRQWTRSDVTGSS